jgi:hypothetical protein
MLDFVARVERSHVASTTSLGRLSGAEGAAAGIVDLVGVAKIGFGTAETLAALVISD